MNDQGNGILLEDESGTISLESGTGLDILLLENAATDAEITMNNYLFVTVGDGLSTTEKIR